MYIGDTGISLLIQVYCVMIGVCFVTIVHM